MIGGWKVCRIGGFHSSAVAFGSALADAIPTNVAPLFCVWRYGLAEPAVTWGDGSQGTVFDPYAGSRIASEVKAWTLRGPRVTRPMTSPPSLCGRDTGIAASRRSPRADPCAIAPGRPRRGLPPQHRGGVSDEKPPKDRGKQRHALPGALTPAAREDRLDDRNKRLVRADEVVEALADAPLPLARLPGGLLGGELPKARVTSSASRRPSANTVERSRAFGSGSEINTEAALAACSGPAEGVVPSRANAAQKGRIDDPPAERVDESDVHGRQAADGGCDPGA
jgi:hypothetical protein